MPMILTKGNHSILLAISTKLHSAVKLPTTLPSIAPKASGCSTAPSAVVAGKTIQRSGNTAIADTGTTLCLVDDSDLPGYLRCYPLAASMTPPSRGYIFPSSTTAAQLPVISFAVGGKQFAVQKEDLGFADAGNGMVYGGIQSRGNNSFDILGDVFLKSIYAIFDQGNTRFGAVSRSDPTQNTSIPASSS
ncbi:hypothetical protein ABVK25_012531 [Lepraria finkii]|uniref:Peptidase A1 domain-containing protein n=1 Tax=Lepraria finkii TaxID=1340010 RepID=A0ABR4AD48_9LECA